MQYETQFIRIGALADRYGVSTESLRVWERQGLIPAAIRTPGGHRRYGQEHVHALDRLMGVPREPIAARPVLFLETVGAVH